MNPSQQVQKYESGSTTLNPQYILFFYENEPRYLFGGNAAFSKIHGLLLYQLMAEVTVGKICTRYQCQATLLKKSKSELTALDANPQPPSNWFLY